MPISASRGRTYQALSTGNFKVKLEHLPFQDAPDALPRPSETAAAACHLALCTGETMHTYRYAQTGPMGAPEKQWGLSMQRCSPAGGPQRQREGLGAGAAGGAHERRALELRLRGSRRQEGIAGGRRSALQRLHDQGVMVPFITVSVDPTWGFTRM